MNFRGYRTSDGQASESLVQIAMARSEYVRRGRIVYWVSPDLSSPELSMEEHFGGFDWLWEVRGGGDRVDVRFALCSGLVLL